MEVKNEMVLYKLENGEVVQFHYKKKGNYLSAYVCGVDGKIPLLKGIIKEILEIAKMENVKLCEISTEVGFLSFGLP